jgi:hypothetical protein
MREKLGTWIATIGAAIMVGACSTRQADSTDPDVTRDRFGATIVTGTWVHAAIGPVYRESMTLTQDGTRVSGTGTYAIEAGRSGPTTIDGTVTGKALTLTIRRDYGLIETFAGTLTDAKHLSGTLAIESSKQPFAYAKQ